MGIKGQIADMGKAFTSKLHEGLLAGQLTDDDRLEIESEVGQHYEETLGQWIEENHVEIPVNEQETDDLVYRGPPAEVQPIEPATGEIGTLFMERAGPDESGDITEDDTDVEEMEDLSEPEMIEDETVETTENVVTDYKRPPELPPLVE